jgi:hypothetical protein
MAFSADEAIWHAAALGRFPTARGGADVAAHHDEVIGRDATEP